MIVALMSSSQGQTAAIEESLGKLGPTTIIARERTGTFTADEIAAVRAMEGVTAVYETVAGNAQATKGGVTYSVSILGIDPATIGTFPAGVVLADGEVPASTDLTKAVVGWTVAFPDENTTFVVTGDVLQLATTTGGALQRGERAQPSTRGVVVAGVLGEFGSSPFVNVDATVFTTPRAAQMMFKLNGYNQLIVLVDDPGQVTAKQTELRALLGDTTNVQSASQLAASVSSIFETLGAIFAGIAAISLIVAGVGIANTMFVSVIERTTEIGLMKALGFKARDILNVFLIEAAVTGLAGGVIGCLLGTGISYAIVGFLNPASSAGGATPPGGTQTTRAPTSAGAGGGQVAGPGGGGFGGGGGGGPTNAISGLEVQPVFTPEVFALVLVFAVVVAVLAGVIPARKASKLDPVVALKRL